MKQIVIASLITLGLLGCPSVHAQVADTTKAVPVASGVTNPDLSPTESETDKIQLKMKDIVIMQMAYQAKSKELTELGTNFNSTQADLDAFVAKVKKAHGWGDDVVFNKVTSTFERVAKPVAPEPSKDAPKK